MKVLALQSMKISSQTASSVPTFYNRNDIIIAKQPDKPEALICKRITALVSANTVCVHCITALPRHTQEGDRIHNTVAPCKYKTVS